jgi:hypothetical protein
LSSRVAASSPAAFSKLVSNSNFPIGLSQHKIWLPACGPRKVEISVRSLTFTRKHLYEDEVIFVHKGIVRVALAGQQYDAGMGATFSFHMGTGSA